jgi:serine/threonine protein kinase
MFVEAQCVCDDLSTAPTKPPPALGGCPLRGDHACGEAPSGRGRTWWADGESLRKWNLPEMATCVLGDELGKGSTGVVLRASLGDGETVVPVAVKVLREATPGCALGQVQQQAERLGDLRHEMLIATKLPWHENIPVFYGVYGIDSDCPKAVWELIDGETLEQIFASRSQREVARLARLSWCRQLFSALACLHGNNMVHRDVKPANVMVTRDLNTVKLVDYGLCREIRDGDVNTQCPVMTGQTGSFRYMAPEVVLESDYGLEVDIYSAAICAYYIIAGSAPFSNLAGQQVAELAARIGLRPALCDKGFENPRLGNLMARAWAHDAANRPDASACVHEMELIIADEEARLRAARSSNPVRAIHRLRTAFKDHINAPVDPQKALAVTRARRSSEMPGGRRLRFFSVGGKTREEVDEDTASGTRAASISLLNLASFVRVRFSRSLPQKAGSLIESSSSSPVPAGPCP